MTSNDQFVSDGKKNWRSTFIISLGALLNLVSLFVDENGGALVAIGCSLIAIGLTVAKRRRETTVSE